MEINTNSKKFIIIAVGLVLLALAFKFCGSIFEGNEYGNYQIKQSAGSGKITVINSPGLYMQNWGKVHTYRVSDENYFSDND